MAKRKRQARSSQQSTPVAKAKLVAFSVLCLYHMRLWEQGSAAVAQPSYHDVFQAGWSRGRSALLVELVQALEQHHCALPAAEDQGSIRARVCQVKCSM